MRIAVCIKQVPSTNEVRMDPVTHTIVRDARQSVTNPFDSYAIELAVQLGQKLNAETWISMGIPATERLLRTPCAAYKAMLLTDRAFAGRHTGHRLHPFLRHWIYGRGRPCALRPHGCGCDTAQIAPAGRAFRHSPCHRCLRSYRSHPDQTGGAPSHRGGHPAANGTAAGAAHGGQGHQPAPYAQYRRCALRP